MDVPILLIFAVTETILCITPGPAVLLTMSQAIAQGWKKSLFGAMGIVTGNTIYFALSAAGVAAIVSASEPIFLTVKIAGVIYLVFSGIRLWRSSPENQQGDSDEPDSTRLKLFAHGLVLQLSNPKAILFFTALLPQFIDPASEMVDQFVVLGIVSVSIEYPILAAYGWLAEKGSRGLAAHHAKKMRERIAGTALIGVGILLGLSQ